MKIGIDIDCVLNDLVENWILYLNNKYNINIVYDDIFTYDMKTCLPKLSNEQIYEPLYLDEFWMSLSPREECNYYLNKLIEDGHDVKLITATVVESMPIKTEWILKHFPYLNKNDIWMVFDKNWINADILLDDYIKNLEGGSYIGVCYSQPWNKIYAGLRVNNWKEFYKLINEMRKSK